MCETLCMRQVGVLGEISEKPSWKLLENVVSTIYKTISNINIVFSNCLQIKYIFASFLTMDDDVLIGKVTISFCQFKENSFSKDFEQAPLNKLASPFFLRDRHAAAEQNFKTFQVGVIFENQFVGCMVIGQTCGRPLVTY